LRTYRLWLVGEADGIVYSIKEYEASSAAEAARRAEALCGHPDDLWWEGQPLRIELRPPELAHAHN
jgi:hypothetical protein